MNKSSFTFQARTARRVSDRDGGDGDDDDDDMVDAVRFICVFGSVKLIFLIYKVPGTDLTNTGR
jgi:hypothetical protein